MAHVTLLLHYTKLKAQQESAYVPRHDIRLDNVFLAQSTYSHTSTIFIASVVPLVDNYGRREQTFGSVFPELGLV